MDKNENERFSLKLSNQIASIASGWKGTVFIDEYLKLKRVPIMMNWLHSSLCIFNGEKRTKLDSQLERQKNKSWSWLTHVFELFILVMGFILFGCQ